MRPRFRPQDIANAAFISSLKAGWVGARNFYRGVRGETQALDFFTGETGAMSPGRRLANDLKKRWHETKAGHKLQRDSNGDIVPVMERNADGEMVPTRQGRVGGVFGLAGDAIVGGSAMALGWGSKAAAGVAGAAALGGVRAAGHLAYQSYGIARDLAVAGGTGLYRMGQHKYGAWALGIAPLGVLAASESYQASEHYAVNRGIAGYQGQNLDSTWGSITESERELVEAGGDPSKLRQVSRGQGQVLDTFGTGGDLVFAMHNQR